MQKKDFKLDFLGIGVGKCATTWIYKCLLEHPQICGSRVKEIHFFDRHYEDGLEWYEKFFADCDQEKIIGEYTPGYLFDEHSAERIYRHFSQAKLIICFRNPVERLISEYYFGYSRGKATGSIDRYFAKLDLERILYYKGLSRYLKYYPKEQIKVVLLEDIKADKKAFIRGIYEFLGADPNFIPPSLEGKANVTVKNKVKFIWLNRFLWSLRRLVRKGKLGQQTRRLFHRIGLNHIAKKIFRLNTKRSNLEDVTKVNPSEELIRKVKEYYREDIKELEKFLGRDLGEWYN